MNYIPEPIKRQWNSVKEKKIGRFLKRNRKNINSNQKKSKSVKRLHDQMKKHVERLKKKKKTRIHRS